ncbi:cation:proton antiporter [Geovibrio thiophilus]|uniref:Cation:proton antiporter n=1 Tax=Geovibrio thiophilus TaxID=139438 RepID=A0A410JW35_9BACT|nr:cation:proton antiporter [Geovibrio thiophilus]QAR32363.1 cation:proton antiporter [Geovibrio thiophilus]
MTLSPNELAVMFLSLGILLFTAKLFGEIAKKYGQPSVLGEILAGIILGPTVLGFFAPSVTDFLFPAEGLRKVVMDSIATISIVLFLLVAGMEADIGTIRKQGRQVFSIGVSGIAAPFIMGFAAAYFFPGLLGMEAGGEVLFFALFIATALAISALPVIAKTLMDLNYYKSELGMLIVASAIFNDIVGWMMFAAVLSLAGKGDVSHMPIYATIALTLLFTLFMITVMRRLIHKILPWVQAHFSWPEGILAFSLALTMVGAAATEMIGIHAIFGAFLVGLALGDTHHFREKTRTIIEQFVSSFFAPLFFASIGLNVNFITNFDFTVTALFLVIGTIGKVAGCSAAARFSGQGKRESFAIGFAMNARGAMEIILGLVALNFGLISEKVFVALVVLAIVTSVISGPAIKMLLKLKKSFNFRDYLEPKAFVLINNPVDKYRAIEMLCAPLSTVTGIRYDTIRAAVMDRESIMPTGLKNGVAIPHARLRDLKKPVIAAGITSHGIDFGSTDGHPAHCVFLILTPTEDNMAQLEILSGIARTFKEQEFDSKTVRPNNFTEFISMIKSNGSA